VPLSCGGNNPAGRLPVTFYKGIEQLPLFEDYSMKTRSYRYFSDDPLYPFGYGLSYAHYAYANLKLSKTSLGAGDPLAVDLDVTNQSCPSIRLRSAGKRLPPA
jgi:beta-glucosidase